MLYEVITERSLGLVVGRIARNVRAPVRIRSHADLRRAVGGWLAAFAPSRGRLQDLYLARLKAEGRAPC